MHGLLGQLLRLACLRYLHMCVYLPAHTDINAQINARCVHIHPLRIFRANKVQTAEAETTHSVSPRLQISHLLDFSQSIII